ncbi:hypothetical protein [Amycolatopsis nigrescens]|uniref:hypothetical protein n=1 Tax=Amycolatopsis nigrescens TaxID=381445 RepID=UPI000375CB17|nr:hypothetical protein [Amycolatopsis nigrescens]
MAGAASFPLANVLLYAVIAVLPTAAGWAILRAPALARLLSRRLRPVRPSPAGPPIQTLAADLRRVHRLLAGYQPGTPAARRTGTRQAYDALLVQASTAVGVEHRLGELAEGMDRELERLRVEEALRVAGLAIP